MKTSTKTYIATTKQRMGEKQRIVEYLNKYTPTATRRELHNYYQLMTGDKINFENFRKRISDIINDGLLVFTGKVVKIESSYYEVLSHRANGYKKAEKTVSRSQLINLVNELKVRNDLPIDLKERVLGFAI